MATTDIPTPAEITTPEQAEQYVRSLDPAEFAPPTSTSRAARPDREAALGRLAGVYRLARPLLPLARASVPAPFRFVFDGLVAALDAVTETA